MSHYHDVMVKHGARFHVEARAFTLSCNIPNTKLNWGPFDTRLIFTVSEDDLERVPDDKLDDCMDSITKDIESAVRELGDLIQAEILSRIPEENPRAIGDAESA